MHTLCVLAFIHMDWGIWWTAICMWTTHNSVANATGITIGKNITFHIINNSSVLINDSAWNVRENYVYVCMWMSMIVTMILNEIERRDRQFVVIIGSKWQLTKSTKRPTNKKKRNVNVISLKFLEMLLYELTETWRIKS